MRWDRPKRRLARPRSACFFFLFSAGGDVTRQKILNSRQHRDTLLPIEALTRGKKASRNHLLGGLYPPPPPRRLAAQGGIYEAALDGRPRLLFSPPFVAHMQHLKVFLFRAERHTCCPLPGRPRRGDGCRATY